MTPNFRILKKPRGYIVEVEELYFMRLKRRWVPFVKSAGLECAWHHKTYDYAMSNLLFEVETQTIKNSRFNKL